MMTIGKRVIRRSLAGLLTVICLLYCGMVTAFADEEAIKSVAVTVTSDVEADAGLGSVSATASSSKYHVTSCDFINTKGDWKSGEVPRVKIVLEAEDGFYFKTINEGNSNIHGGTYVSAKKENQNHTLNLTVKLKPVKGTLATVEDAYWDESPLGKARWTKVDGAPAYELKLYCGDSMVYRVERTTTNYYDFYPQMTRQGDYYYRVRAVAKNESDAEYIKAGEWAESTAQEVTKKDARAAESQTNSNNPNASGPDQTAKGPADEAPGWFHDGYGWWYRNADQSYTRNDWQLIDGKWYLFNMSGYMLTGWQTKNDHEYYLTSNGDMLSGWVQLDRSWYYLDPQWGKQSGGWLSYGDRWYYLNPDGTMATGWIKNKGNWYYLDPNDGHMLTDQTVENYYVNSDGIWVP